MLVRRILPKLPKIAYSKKREEVSRIQLLRVFIFLSELPFFLDISLLVQWLEKFSESEVALKCGEKKMKAALSCSLLSRFVVNFYGRWIIARNQSSSKNNALIISLLLSKTFNVSSIELYLKCGDGKTSVSFGPWPYLWNLVMALSFLNQQVVL